MQNLVGQISKRSKKRIFYYSDSVPIFEKYGVQKQIDDAFHRQVWLRCGGYIVIDETEALIAIDVNTGRNKGARDVETMNLELAPEDRAFRDEVRAFLEASLPEHLREAGRNPTSVFTDKKYNLAWQKILHARGWAAPAWPKEFGGPGWSVMQRYIFAAECARAFHLGIAQGLCDAVATLCEALTLDTVVLSGGVFQNQLLLADIQSILAGTHLVIWTNRDVPPNDGGISLGQAAIAALGAGRS